MAATIGVWVGLMAVSPVAASSGGELRLHVFPKSGIRGGQSIDFVIRGRALVPEKGVEVWQCDSQADLAVGGTLDDLSESCTGPEGRAVFEPGIVTGSVTVQEVFTTYPLEPEPPRPVHCGDSRRDCAMVAVVRAIELPGTIEALSVVPIDVRPSPVAVGGQGLVGGSGTVQVWISGPSGAKLRVAQCVRFPGVPRDLDSCQVDATVVLSRNGQATTEVAVVPSLVVGGTTYDCRSRPCQVTVFDRAGAIFGASDIPGSVPYADVTLDRSTGLVDGDLVHARIQSAIPASSPYLVALCVASVLEDLFPSQGCHVYSPIAGPGDHTYELTVLEEFTPFAGGPPLSCHDDPNGCIIGVGTETTAAGFAPITFATPSPP